MSNTANSSSPAAASPVVSPDAKAFVERSLGSELDAFPADVRAALVDKFCAEYASPMTREVELVLRKRLTDDEVRHLMFCPTPAQNRHYAALISLRPAAASSATVGNASASAPAWPAVLQKRFLTLFYLKHARNWGLVAEFVLLDGLAALADLFVHADLQVRGQAIDCFVQITSSASFDWFADPVGYEARVLHSKMLALAAPRSPFLANIVRNVRCYESSTESSAADASIPSDDRYDAATTATESGGAEERASQSAKAPLEQLPGGTFVLLQVLAFFLSWLRKFFAENNELRLSRELLELLRNWRARTQTQEPAELELAQTVYEDFSRWPPIDEPAADASTESDGEVGASDGESSAPHCAVSTAGAAVSESTAPARESLFSRERIERLLDRDGANEASAIWHCSQAIEARACLLDAHLLRARALTQQIERQARAKQQTPGAKVTQQAYDDVHRVMDDCSEVLKLDASNVEARKYHVRALFALEMWGEALEVLDEWVLTDRDTLERSFLPDDIAFFCAQRAVATDRRRAQADARARQQRLDAVKHAKQEEIFRAILQRDKASRAARAKSPRAASPTSTTNGTITSTTTTTSTTEQDSIDAQDPLPASFASRKTESPRASSAELGVAPRESLAASESLLSKLMARGARLSGAKPQRAADPATEQLRRAHAFARRFRQARADAPALAALLLETPPGALASAFDAALTDEHLLAAVDALVALERQGGARAAAAAERRRLLAHSARFAFVLDAACDSVRERLQDYCGSSDAPAATESRTACA